MSDDHWRRRVGCGGGGQGADGPWDPVGSPKVTPSHRKIKTILQQNEKPTKFISCWLGCVLQGAQPAGGWPLFIYLLLFFYLWLLTQTWSALEPG